MVSKAHALRFRLTELPGKYSTLPLVVGKFSLILCSSVVSTGMAEAAELMRVMMNATIKEQGCHHYAYSRDLSTPNRFQLSELWEDDDALASRLSRVSILGIQPNIFVATP